MTYVFRATATTVASRPVSNSADVTVTVKTAGVSAAISGGDRQVGFESTWALDASTSRDRDGLASTLRWATMRFGLRLPRLLLLRLLLSGLMPTHFVSPSGVTARHCCPVASLPYSHHVAWQVRVDVRC